MGKLESRTLQERTVAERSAIVDKMREKGIDPYPAYVELTHSVAEALQSPEGTSVKVGGRIVGVRGHGKIQFLDVLDASGKIQVVCSDTDTAEFGDMEFFQQGDFVQVIGDRFVTRRGEQSIKARNIVMASKTLDITPDPTSRVDQIMRDPAQAERLRLARKIQRTVEGTLEDMGYMAVRTPILQPIYGGANARPFVTHSNAYDADYYLQISPELYLKRAVVAGFDRVYTIATNFRNESHDKTHSPEFQMLEAYMAWGNYEDMMVLTEEIYRNVAYAIHGTGQVEYQGVKLDFDNPWRRLKMKDGIRQYLGYDVDSMSDEEIKQAMEKEGVELKGEWVRGLAINKLFDPVEKFINQPTFITHQPAETTTLCKRDPNDPSVLERFEPMICGIEIGNAYSEQNDPRAQYQAFLDERAGDPEAHPMDMPYVRDLQRGLPPTGGLGLGMDRLAMIMLDRKDIDDVIFYPMVNPVTYVNGTR